MNVGLRSGMMPVGRWWRHDKGREDGEIIVHSEDDIM